MEKIYNRLQSRFKENLSHQSVRILQHIQVATNPTIKEIAEAFRLSHNTTSEHVKKLEKLGYIEKKESGRSTSSNDRFNKRWRYHRSASHRT
ncbi:MarR family transcriptional regulator [Exiguobacterium acetylicum]|uniref:MarR family transcriptional regulator n=1 Tax=Exiguobacterium acetylicum TaxID=41170 RepID=UPI0034D4A6D8